MDSRRRDLERRGALSGAPDDDAASLSARLRAGEIEYNQLLLAASADIPGACLALGLTQEQAEQECNAILPAPSRDLFESIVVQVETMWWLNTRLGWGFTSGDFASLPLPTVWPNDTPHNSARPAGGLTAVTLVPYLDTVGDTFEALWQAIQARYHKHSRDSEIKSGVHQLKLLDGIVHPGKCLRWEYIDLAANWYEENGVAPRDVRSTKSSHAGVLASAALHRKWVEHIDGTTVPRVYLGGYQSRYKQSCPWVLLPSLFFIPEYRSLCLHLDIDDTRGHNSAIPVSMS